MKEFKREHRYFVLKLKDLNPLLRWLINFLPRRTAVVIEEDWPEYEAVWAMIEARVQKEQKAQL